MPSATESTVPTSERSAASVSRPSIRALRIFEISSGLISTLFSAPCRNSRRARLRSRGDFLSQFFQLAAQARVEDHVAHAQYEAAEDLGIDLGLQVDLPVGLALNLFA